MIKSTLPATVFDQHIVLLGKTRAGKSTVLRGSIAEPLLRAGEPVTIVDPKGDWWGLKLAPDGRGPGFPVVIFGGEHADVPLDPRAGAHVGELLATGNRPALIDMGGWMPGERTRFWIDFASAMFRHVKGRRWLLVDEVHNFAPKGKVLDVDAGKALHWTNRLASEGLGKGIHMAFASQRPQKVHNDTLTSAETLIALKVIHKADRDAVLDWVDGCGDRPLGKEMVESLAHLKRAEAWAWSPEAEFGPKRIQFPMFKTYDSFRPQSVDDVKKLKGWASVDLDDVRVKLSEFVEQAQANDPKALRAEIAKLKGELAKKPVAASSAPADAGALEKARVAGWNAGYLVGASDVSKRDAGNIREGLRYLTEAMPNLRTLEKFLTDCAKYLDKGLPPERLILTVLAQHGEVPVERVAAIAGYAVKGGGFNNALGALRSKGYMVGLKITEEGLAALGPFEPLPTGADLLNHWMGKLGKAERAILGAAAEGHTDKETIARQAGYEPSGGGFNNALGKLRTLGLISGRGAIELHEDLR